MKKRILAAMLAAAMAISMAACTGGGDSSAPDSGSSESSGSASGTSGGESEANAPAGENGTVWDAYTPYDETVVFTTCRQKPAYDQGFVNGDDILNNPYTRYVEEVVNVRREIAWEADPNTYPQKLALSVASGDIPDVMFVDRKMYKQLIQNDLIQDMGEAYEKCTSPFLKEKYDSYGERLFQECTVDGKLMGLPETTIYGNGVYLCWIRTDYLDKVGLEIPQNIEELKAAAKAFVENDVSGTGETIGFSVNTKMKEYASTFFYADGNYPGWWVNGEGEKAVYGSTLPEMKTTLERLRDMYADGILDKEFAIRKDEDRNAMIASGQTGIFFGGWWPSAAMGDCVVNNKEADWAPIAIKNTEGGLAVPEADPVYQILVVNKNFEHPEAIVKAHNVYFDAIRGNGDGKRIYDEIAETCPNIDWGVGPVPLNCDDYDAIKLLTDDLNQALEKGDKSAMKVQSQSMNFDIIMEERNNPKQSAGNYVMAMARTVGSEAITADYITINPTAYFGTTETMTNKWANLQKLEDEMFVQIVMGEKPIEYFDEFVTQWYALGGQTITDEVNAEMK